MGNGASEVLEEQEMVNAINLSHDGAIFKTPF